MNACSSKCHQGSAGFTLIELLVVITIIGILSSLVISVVGNVAQTSRETIAEQQRVVVQEALNAWIINESSTGNNSVAFVQSNYNASGNRLNLIRDYLSTETYNWFTNLSGNQFQSTNMQRIGKRISFTAWSNNTPPTVILQ